MNLSRPGDEPSSVHADRQPRVKEMIVMPKRVAALVATALVGAAATLAWNTPALADTPGFAVKVTQAPQTFTIGKDVRTLAASVSTDRAGQRCRKVRWALVIQTQGISLNQIRVGRVEGGQPFQVNTQLGADAAVVVDAQVDPGQLCRNQTDSAEWEIGFTGPDDGQVAFEIRALNTAGQVLASADTGSNVVTPVSATTGATPSDSPSDSPSAAAASPSSTFSAEPTEAAAVTPTASLNANPAASAARTGGPSVLGPGLIIGAVLVFVGVALLLRLRSRNRNPVFADDTQMMPTGFYNLPRRR
jgi:hypothetical protein